jgi:hypothetical protein
MSPGTNGQHEKLLKALIDIGQELASTIELEELLNRILKISREVFHFEMPSSVSSRRTATCS